MTTSDARPIGVFDSGVGGLSAMKELARQVPGEDIIYLADCAHCPYGARPLEEIRRLTEGIVAFLLARQAKTIVVACNTASAAALHHLRATFQVPIVGMEPALKPAVEKTKSKVVGVIATQATFQGELFASLMDRFAGDARVITRACPGLVERVEAGQLDDAETESLLRRYLEPMLEEGMDYLALGCTHYPFLTPLIQRVVGPGVEIIDPSPAVARQTKRTLEREGLLNKESRRGAYTFYTSGDPEAFRQLQMRLTSLPGRVKALRWEGDQLISA
jgi:glutamate racemase